jgi:hypothetical protein
MCLGAIDLPNSTAALSTASPGERSRARPGVASVTAKFPAWKTGETALQSMGRDPDSRWRGFREGSRRT